ncbi:MAG: sigma-70 family RNA polymerase sigma factor [Tannerella sp.]|jgi:RNA polymerase sigma factor (sigma-70 family)|nr:sigma-70 family RNA polymerase sigma factor [Tannerella sp.]
MTDRHNKQIDVLYRAHINELFAYAIGFGFDSDTSMDAIHDVFCRICAEKPLVGNVANIRAYLFRSVKNRLLDIRKTRHDTPAPVDEIAEMVPFRIETSVEDELIEDEEQAQLKRKVEQLLKNLTDRQREIIWLRYEQNFDYESISQIMCITESSCRKLIHKTISKLREQAWKVSLLFLIHF